MPKNKRAEGKCVDSFTWPGGSTVELQIKYKCPYCGAHIETAEWIGARGFQKGVYMTKTDDVCPECTEHVDVTFEMK